MNNYLKKKFKKNVKEKKNAKYILQYFYVK